MKKYICLPVLAAALVLVLASCGGTTESCREVAERYAAAMPGTSGGRVMFYRGADPDSPEYLSDGDLCALYYYGRADAGEPDMLEDWCVIMSASPEVAEVHVLRVRHKSDRTAVARMAEARARVLRSPELFAARAGFWGARPDSAEVVIDGRDVILISN